MSGSYSLNSGETLTAVQIAFFDVNHRLASGGNATVDKVRRTWSASVGDFRTAYYRVVFYFKDARGVNRNVYGTTYTW